MNARWLSAPMLLLFLLIQATASPPLRAQDLDEDRAGPAKGDLRREMRKFFSDRLRAELDLTDAQAEEILPQLQRLERNRGELRRQRGDAMQQLRDGSDSGATDDELQALLDQFDRTEREQLDLKRSAYAEIDQQLTVRQRVRLRFFVEGFPRMMREKIMEIRGEAGPGRERGPRPDRRPPGERP